MPPDRQCTVDGCDGASFARGWCPAHYQRWRQKGDLGGPIARRQRAQGVPCSIEDCDRLAVSLAMCDLHYQRWCKYGDPYFTPRPRLGTGRTIDSAGYVRLTDPSHPLATKHGWVSEHRKVVHDAGIEVPPGHHVHHRNGDKADNRLENLEVISESEHHRQHIAEAGTVTNQYGTFPLRCR